MMYVVSTGQYFDKSEMCIVFDENTESSFSSNTEALNKLIQENMMAPGYMQSAKNSLWYNEVYSRIRDVGAQFTVLCKVDDKFKLVGHREKVGYVNTEQLREYVKEHNVTNCEIKTNGEFRFTGVHELARDTEFEDYINKKYERYVLKSTLMGRNMAFDYIIEGKRIKLKKYTGTTKNVIVPEFINTIMNRAFQDTGIEQILIQDGLEYIGCSAFKDCKLSTITIPSTVKFIGKEAFHRNKRLLTSENEYREEKIKIINAETVALDNWHSPLHIGS